jgi:hypothetical protein
MNKVVAIGSVVEARGYEFTVVGNQDLNYDGYCPEGAVIGQNRAGKTILHRGEYALVANGYTN